MHDAVREAWPAYTASLEGVIDHFYLDINGDVTIGYGNLVDPVDRAIGLPMRFVEDLAVLATPLEIRAEWSRVKWMPRGLLAKHYRGALRLSSQALDALRDRMLAANEAYLVKHHFPDWEDWPADAQMGALSLVWSQGAGLRDWPKFRAACRCRAWLTAAKESQINTAGNPGVISRNEHHKHLFTNAMAVEMNREALDPSVLWFPEVKLVA